MLDSGISHFQVIFLNSLLRHFLPTEGIFFFFLLSLLRMGRKERDANDMFGCPIPSVAILSWRVGASLASA